MKIGTKNRQTGSSSSFEDKSQRMMMGIDISKYVPELVAEGMTEEQAYACAEALATITKSFVDAAFDTPVPRSNQSGARAMNPVKIDGEIAIAVKTPETCTQEELQEFQRLVERGGEVNAKTLPSGIKRAVALAFARDSNGALVGVAGLKNPSASYRTKIFRRSGVSNPDAYAHEVGWVYVDEHARGQKLGARVTSQLLALTKDGVYATSATGNGAMHDALLRSGFSAAGTPYASTEREGVQLQLFIR